MTSSRGEQIEQARCVLDAHGWTTRQLTRAVDTDHRILMWSHHDYRTSERLQLTGPLIGAAIALPAARRRWTLVPTVLSHPAATGEHLQAVSGHLLAYLTAEDDEARARAVRGWPAAVGGHVGDGESEWIMVDWLVRHPNVTADTVRPFVKHVPDVGAMMATTRHPHHVTQQLLPEVLEGVRQVVARAVPGWGSGDGEDRYMPVRALSRMREYPLTGEQAGVLAECGLQMLDLSEIADEFLPVGWRADLIWELANPHGPYWVTLDAASRSRLLVDALILT